MEILCISDISWEEPDTDIVEELKDDIDSLGPSLLLFAGDIINDGWNKHEHVDEFIEILDYLEDFEISSFTISGNHDEYSNYDAVIEKTECLEYAEEISGEAVEFNGLKILGIPYSYTHSLRDVRDISEDFPGSYDIVLAHAEHRRRIWLFELDTDIILTGHSGSSMSQIQNRAFVTMYCYPNHYVTIEPDLEEITYTQSVSSFRYNRDQYQTRFSVESGEIQYDYSGDDSEIPFNVENLTDSNYKERVQALVEAKSKVEEVGEAEEKEIVENLLDLGVPKTHIREYIHRYDFL